MIATDTVHAPASATTLIVPLGLLPTPLQTIVVMSVIILIESYRENKASASGSLGRLRVFRDDETLRVSNHLTPRRFTEITRVDILLAYRATLRLFISLPVRLI